MLKWQLKTFQREIACIFNICLIFWQTKLWNAMDSPGAGLDWKLTAEHSGYMNN